MFFKKKVLFVIFFSVFVLSNAQNFSKDLQGKIKSESMELSDVHVVNITSKKATITDQHGDFKILVKLNDTLWFSSIQHEKSHLVVTNMVLETEKVIVNLKETLTVLEEVVIPSHKLSGNLDTDIKSMKFEPVISALTVGLPNADVKTLSVNERRLFYAMTEQGLHRLIDEMTGHNKRLRKMVFLDEEKLRLQTLKSFYPDSFYSKHLKIPSERIYDFIYFCAEDSIFNSTIESHNKLKIWEFLEKRSLIYRESNDL